MMELSAFRMMSNDFARLAVRHWGGGQPTNGRQDKSRSLRPGRPAADGRKINDLSRCALLRDSLRFVKAQAKSATIAHRAFAAP
jgi:hypothetical protein